MNSLLPEHIHCFVSWKFQFDLSCSYAFAVQQCWLKALFSSCPSAAYVHSFRQILLPRYLMNGFSILDETYREYSRVPTDDSGGQGSRS